MTFDLEQHFVGPEVLEIELQRLSFWELVHRRKDNALYLEHKLNSLSWSRSDSVDQDSLQLSTEQASCQGMGTLSFLPPKG